MECPGSLLQTDFYELLLLSTFLRVINAEMAFPRVKFTVAVLRMPDNESPQCIYVDAISKGMYDELFDLINCVQD